MKCIKIKSVRVELTNEEVMAIERAVDVAREILEQVDEIDGETILRQPDDFGEDEFITPTEVERTIEILEFLKDVYRIE